MTPIMVPMATHIERECIIQGGKKYCETADFSKRDIGFIILGTIAIVCYIFFLFWLADFFENSWFLFLGILIPALILAFAFII